MKLRIKQSRKIVMNRQQFEKIYPAELSSTQNEVLKLVLQGKKNKEIADQLNFSESNPAKHIKKIAEKFELHKQYPGDYRNRIIDLFCKYKRELVAPEIVVDKPLLTFPDKPEKADSYFYIDRKPIESKCFHQLSEAGSLLRIAAPKQMGKTSLLNKIIAKGKQQHYHTVSLDLRLMETKKLADATIFLRSFYAWIINELDSSPPLREWDDDLPVMVSCTKHFQAILKQLDRPFLLVIDNLDRIFDYPQTYQNFLPMLRRWHDLANESETWEKLRLIISYRTEDYGRLDINQSPFNVGVPISVREFNYEEIELLRKRHYQLQPEVLEPLIQAIGGHPYLIRLAFYTLAKEELTLEQVLKNAASYTGIYKNHFRQLVGYLQECSGLENILQEIVGKKGLEITGKNHKQIYQLEAMGIIKIKSTIAVISRQIYQSYFANYFKS